MLIGRNEELRQLRLELERWRPSLVVIHGQRGSGKTALLLEALKDQSVVYYRGQHLAPSDNVSLFQQTVERDLGVDLSAASSWESIFNHLQQFALRAPRPVTVFLDDFPLVCEPQSDLAATLGRLWERIVATAPPLNLVLCGSQRNVMKRLADSRGPLRTRPSLELEVKPLDYMDTARFFSSWPLQDRLSGYGVFGGVPQYLVQCDDTRSLRSNVVDLILHPSGPLHDEPYVQLQADLQNPARYASVLHAIGQGCSDWRSIAKRVPEVGSGGALGVYLKKLEELELIRVVRSLDADRKARNRRYHLADPFIQFWCRFVLPNRSALQTIDPDQVFARHVQPSLDQHMEGVFASVCREYVNRYAPRLLSSAIKESGEIWGKACQVPVAARLTDGTVILGECQWSGRRTAAELLESLRICANNTSLVKSIKKCHFLVFVRDRVLTDLPDTDISPEQVHLIRLEELLAGA